MSKKIITDEGKNELLRLAFQSEEAGGTFSYLALGGPNSAGAQGEEFKEVSGSEYARVKTTATAPEDKTITISAVFDESNYAPSSEEGGAIKEIGLCNTDIINEENEKFFMYSEVPTIYKTNDISLQYTIIISID